MKIPGIKVFCHAVDLPGGREILQEQLSLLRTSGLAHVADIYIHCNYNMHSYIWALEEYKDYLNIKFVNFDAEPKDYETVTLMHLHDVCTMEEDNIPILYLHAKGVTRIEHSTIPDINANNKAWRHCLEYFCIERWGDCVQKLLYEGYDCAGAGWVVEPFKCFAGNIWWASSQYIKNLPSWQRPKGAKYSHQFPKLMQDPWGEYRMENEGWIGFGNPKAYCMHSINQDPYVYYIDPSSYRKINYS